MNKKELAAYIDETVLNAWAGTSDMDALCERARKYEFASVCVNPVNVAYCAEKLKGSPVAVCTVIGFPLGADTTADKAAQAACAVKNGACEVDMVIDIGKAREENYKAVGADIDAVVKAARRAGEEQQKAGLLQRNVIVKVILETCYLSDSQICECSLCAKHAGADFVKTSTGFGTPKDAQGNPLPAGATVHAVSLMRQTVGSGMGVKASGSIRDTRTALAMIAAGANRIGTSSGKAIVDGLQE